MAYLNRVVKCLLAILVGLDQLAQTILVAPFALLCLSEPPDPDETISGLLGRHESAWWSYGPILLINSLFFLITFGADKDHCQRIAIKEAKIPK